jgi:two-component system, LytTR family, sensor kinase
MIVAAAWIVPAFLAAVNEIAQSWIWNGRLPGWRDVAFPSLDWFVYGALTPGVFAASRRWPLARPHVVAHTLIHLAMGLVFCGAWAGIGTVLKGWLQPHQMERGASVFFTSWVFITLPFGVTVYLSMVGVEHAIRWFVEAREREVQIAQLSEQLATARLDSLRSQLNPHFLFNTLNSIAVLARGGDRDDAARMVEHLSEILRRTLRESRSEVPLSDELDLVRRYLEIEQARFSDRLAVDFDIAPDVEHGAVPSFAVQHLVDNAIRHGVSPRAEGGRIAIVARREGARLEISVSDDGVGANIGMPEGRGLANTRERLRALHDDRASLAVSPRPAGGTVATLRLPWREVQAEAAHDR